MGTETERIQLDLATKFYGSELDAAIRGYEKLLGLHEQLAARLAQPLKFGVTGLAEATRQIDALAAKGKTRTQAFHDELIRLGDPAIAARVASGSKTIDAVLAERGRALDKLKRQALDARAAAEQQSRFHEKTDFMGLGFGADKGSRLQKESRDKLTRLTAEAKLAEQQYDAASRAQKKLTNAALYSPPGSRETAAEAKMREAEERLKAKTTPTKGSGAATVAAAASAGGSGGAGFKPIAEGAGGAAREMGLLTVRTNEAGEVISKLYSKGQGIEELQRATGKTVQTQDMLAESTARVADRQNAYRVAMAQASGSLAQRAQINQDNIRGMIEEARVLQSLGLQHTDEAAKIRGLISTRLAERASIRAGMAAQETQQQRMQEALQAEVTMAERLARVRTVSARYDRLQAGAGTPLEKADVQDRRAAALRREATEMRNVGVAENEILRVKAKANAAENESVRLRASVAGQQQRAQDQLQAQVHLEEKARDIARTRGMYQTALSDKSLDSGARAALLDRQAIAVRRQATEMEALGAQQAKVLELQKEAMTLEARARAVRSRQQVTDDTAAARRGQASTVSGTFNPAGYTVGDRTTRVRAGGSGGMIREETAEYSKLTGSIQENVRVMRTFDDAGRLIGSTVRSTNTELKDLGRTGDFAARSFLHNTLVVASWAASVAAFQAVVATIREGASATVELEAKTALLLAVFRYGTEEAYRLRDGVVALAVANGRSGDEAIDAATRFARMGLTRVQTLEAVRVALIAANVAEISSAEAAGYLSAIMAAFNLNVRDLSVVLNELNTISNTYNVTNKDMLEGIARVGNLAKQARLPLEELMGIIATGVGRTGRAGSEFGNAIKAMIVSTSTPGIQQKLKIRFDFDVKDDVGQLKDFSTLLSELYVKYQQLGMAEQQELLQRVGQKQQASRLAAVLDGYVQTQVLAIRAQRDLNSAERENQAIRGTMLSQIRSVATEFQRAFLNIAAGNSSSVVTGVIQNSLEFITNLLKLLSVMPQVTAVVAAMLLLMAYRLVRLAVAFDGASAQGNYFANTAKQVSIAMASMSASVNRANRTLAMSGGAVGGFAKGMRGAAASVLLFTRGIPILASVGVWIARILKVATFAIGTFTSLLGGILAIAATEAVFWGINKAVDYFSGGLSKSQKEMARLNETAEVFGRKASANEQAARLISTVTKASQGAYFSKDQGHLAATGIAEAVYPNDQTKQRALRDELEVMYEQKDTLALQARGQQLQANLIDQAKKDRLVELGATQKLVKEQESALRIVRQQIALKNSRHESADAEREKEKELTEATEKLRDRQQKAYEIPDNPQTDSPDIKNIQAYATGRDAALDRFSQKLPAAFTDTEGVKRDIGLLEAKRQVLKSNNEQMVKGLQLAKDQADQAAAPLQKRRDEMAAIRASNDELRKKRDEYAQLAEAMRWTESKGGLINGPKPPQGIMDLRARGKREGWTADMAMRQARAIDEHLKSVSTGEEQGPFVRGHGNDYGRALQPAQEDRMIESEDHRIAMYNRVGQAMQTEIDLNKTQLRQELDKIDLKEREYNAQMRIAQATDTAEKATRAAKAEEARHSIGRDDIEKTINQSKALIDQSIPAAQGKLLGDRFAVAAPNTKDKDQYRLDAISQQVQIQQHLNQLQTNEAALVQQRAEKEADIENIKRRQVQEASKSLLLASREEQLQAALIARYSQKRGGQGFSVEDYQFLSQGTRQNIDKFTPNLAPPELNNELREAQRSLAMVNEAFDGLSKKTAELAAKFDTLNPAKAAAEFAGVPPASQPPPAVTLSIGNFNIHLSDQMGALIQEFKDTAVTWTKAYVDPQFAEMRNLIRSLSPPKVNNSFARE